MTERAPRRDAQWWLYPETGRSPHTAIDTIITTIRTNQNARYSAYRRWAKAYGANISAFGLSPSYSEAFSEQLRANELASTVDTLVAQVFKNRVVPSPHTVGGDWEERERTEELGRWLDGAYDDASVFDDAIPKAGLAAFLFGTGPMKVSSEVIDEEKKLARIIVEYAPTQLCYVDEIEGRFGKPPNFHQEHLVDRYKLLADYACEGDEDEYLVGTREEREKAILDATHTANDQSSYSYSQESDQVVVRESWHLRSSAGATDGWRCVTINSATLYMAPYKRKRFPFAFIKHGISLGDFWGQSLVQRLEPMQAAQDRLDKNIDEAHQMMGILRVIMRKNCGISLDHIDDIPFAILQANDPNTDIREWNAQPVHPDVYAHREAMAPRMRGIAGVSGYSAQGQIPAGLRNASGAALDAYEDTENARHAMIHHSYEAAVIDLAEIIIDEAEELAERGYSVTVYASHPQDRNSSQFLDFKEVQQDRKSYVLRIPPIAQLAKSFSARLEQLKQLVNDGAISMTTYRRMLGNPDVEAENEIDTADDDIILKNFHTMIKSGEPTTVLSTDAFDRIVALSGKFVNWCRVQNVSSSRWALVLQYADEAIRAKENAIKEAAAKQAAASAAASAVVPGAAPSAPVPDLGAPPPPPPPDAGGAPPPDPSGAMPPGPLPTGNA